MLHPIFQSHLPQVIKLFKDYRVKNAFAFGSVVSEKFDEKSDVDLLINFEDGIEPLEKGEMWWDLHDSLRKVFNREIDLVIEEGLKNPYFIEELNEKKQLIYAS